MMNYRTGRVRATRFARVHWCGTRRDNPLRQTQANWPLRKALGGFRCTDFTYPVTPHVFQHTTAVHLLEAGVEVNVIHGWLGHVNLETPNRYAEITLRMKAEALGLCDPVVSEKTRKSAWRDDAAMLAWLSAL